MIGPKRLPSLWPTRKVITILGNFLLRSVDFLTGLYDTYKIIQGSSDSIRYIVSPTGQALRRRSS